MHKITVNGASIAYDEAGTGSPVVLLHAGIADRRMWRGQLSALAARHRVIVPDLRGYGDSELPRPRSRTMTMWPDCWTRSTCPGPPWSAAPSVGRSPSTPRWPTPTG
ncbi:alpha/beta fold hydrolase [Micromonospora sp. LH3U1]|nr:alpha/beta fold hydrolase [Micromonospora sp. LH3U1]WCN81081.1 alpha/beta fold hydrolase [Micromonospora sp. LH3U1]